ncbi:MAG: flagellar biosynthesis repressor FlbT [Roseinatronobacter sp.]
MTGLIIRLAPFERMLLNGAIIENGERRTNFAIKSPNAHVLRLRDAILPEQANTPVKRACYLFQLILSGDSTEDEIRQPLLRAIEQLSHVFHDSDSRNLLDQAARSIVTREYYLGLKQIRKLLPREARIFAASLQ